MFTLIIGSKVLAAGKETGYESRVFWRLCFTMASKVFSLSRSSFLSSLQRSLTAPHPLKIQQKSFATKQKKDTSSSPAQPKRAPSPFALYVRENFQRRKEENNTIKTPQLLTTLANEWHSVSEGDKQKYRAQSDQLKADYQEKLEEYKSTLPPPLPKRPVSSSYALFIKENFAKTRERNSGLSFPDAQKEMAKEWRELSEEDKDLYRRKFEEMIEEYKQHVIEYESNLKDEGREFMEKVDKEGLKKLRKKKLEFLNYPKRPGGAFVIFLAKQRESFPRGFEESQKDWVKRMSVKWNALSDEEKSVYRDVQEEKLREYRNDDEEWKNKHQQNAA